MAKGNSSGISRVRLTSGKVAPAGFAPGLSLQECIAAYGSERNVTAEISHQAKHVMLQYEDRLDPYQRSALTRELMAHAAKWLKRQHSAP